MPRPQQIVGAILLMGLAAALLSRLYPLQDQGQEEAALERERQALQTRLLLPRPYLFIHIPKSGGTAIGKLAEQAENGGPGFIRYWHHPREQRVIAEMLQHDFVFGHFKYGVHAHFEPRPCTYMTIMRDPIDRVVSHYYYHRASVTDRFHHLARDNTLDRWVELSLDGQNDQVQFISGIYGKVNESVYAVAEHNLRSFGFVGLYELMDESVVMMQYFAGFQNLLFNKTKAVTDRPHTSDLPEETRLKVAKYNEYDIRLYTVAQEMFRLQVHRMGPHFQQLVQRFRHQQEQYRQHVGCVDCLAGKHPSATLGIKNF